jgi:hypothetical protein
VGGTWSTPGLAQHSWAPGPLCSNDTQGCARGFPSHPLWREKKKKGRGMSPSLGSLLTVRSGQWLESAGGGLLSKLP